MPVNICECKNKLVGIICVVAGEATLPCENISDVQIAMTAILKTNDRLQSLRHSPAL
jgi:hypothetical protein